MIKLIVYIVVIVNFVGLVNCGADKCTPYKCQGLYRDCGKPGQICSEGLYCNTGDSTPVCYSRVEEFNGCTSNIQCKKGTVCVTKHYDRYCKEIGFKGYGEECYLPEECSTGLDCMNNTCDHTPQMCTTYSCPYGKFCSQKKVCTPLITDGDECDPLEPHCYPGSICSGGFNDTICRPAYSRSEGDPCNNDISCDIGKGLGCKNGICTKYKPHVDSNKVYCLDDTVCFIGIEKCICNNVTQFEGKCQQVTKIGLNCSQAYHAYYACLMTNQCIMDIQNPYSPRSCQTQHCTQELCDYQSKCMIPEYSCERYLKDPQCAPTANSSPSLIDQLSSPTLLLLNLLLLLSLPSIY